MQQNALQQAWLFLLELSNGNRFVLQADADNIPLQETGEDTGVFTGQIWQGGTIELTLPQVLKIERYKIDTFNGSGHKTYTYTETQMADILERAPRTAEGEVKPAVEKISDSKGETLYESDRSKKMHKL
jgi:hypothetical protein